MGKNTIWIRTRRLSDGGVSYDLRPARLMLGQYGQTGGDPLALTLPPEWSGLTVTAVFTPKNGRQIVCDVTDAGLPIPPSMMHAGGGTLYLDGVDSAGRHLRTTAVRYEIGSTARDSGLPNIVGTIGGGGAIDVCRHGPVYGKGEPVKPGGF